MVCLHIFIWLISWLIPWIQCTPKGCGSCVSFVRQGWCDLQPVAELCCVGKCNLVFLQPIQTARAPRRAALLNGKTPVLKLTGTSSPSTWCSPASSSLVKPLQICGWSKKGSCCALHSNPATVLEFLLLFNYLLFLFCSLLLPSSPLYKYFNLHQLISGSLFTQHRKIDVQNCLQSGEREIKKLQLFVGVFCSFFLVSL